MLEGNTDEIRMEIHSQFVEQHEYPRFTNAIVTKTDRKSGKKDRAIV